MHADLDTCIYCETEKESLLIYIVNYGANVAGDFTNFYETKQNPGFNFPLPQFI